MKKKSIPTLLKWTIRGLPLAAAAGTVVLPLSRVGHQFAVLIILVWLQVFFIFECFLGSK